MQVFTCYIAFDWRHLIGVIEMKNRYNTRLVNMDRLQNVINGMCKQWWWWTFRIYCRVNCHRYNGSRFSCILLSFLSSILRKFSFLLENVPTMGTRGRGSVLLIFIYRSRHAVRMTLLVAIIIYRSSCLKLYVLLNYQVGKRKINLNVGSVSRYLVVGRRRYLKNGAF